MIRNLKNKTKAVYAPADKAGAAAEKEKPAPLYAKQIKIHPKRVWGAFRKLKWVAMIALLSFYYIAPWFRWDRGPGIPDQALLIDISAQRAYFLWIEIWPQEVYYITGILILAALGLFLATALFGRVWCGFACPQTVWTDLYVWVERIIEGDRAARIRLDKAPYSKDKIFKRVIKHFIWLYIALLTGGAWIMYFVDAPTFINDLFFKGEITGNSLFFIGLFTVTTYLLAGFGREQVCTYMCPWPRIQGSMTDEDSMIVTYETWRGEPRAKPARDGDYSNRGHCIDCGNCVVVCPMGIDIRDGNQLECIGCGLCIDACDNIMEKLKLPKGLIAYDSVNRQIARSDGKAVKRKLVRPRTIFYAILLTLVTGVILYTFGTREHLEVNILKDRQPVFVTLKDGSIRNGYEVKILNKTQHLRSFLLNIEGLENPTMKLSGAIEQTRSIVIEVQPDDVKAVHVFVAVPRKELKSDKTEITFSFVEMDPGYSDGSLDILNELRENQKHQTTFNGPKK
ncbi:cytochrome c oxidase accessory protein CcoG [Curvivirga aplysinae]|uniref:cytochrome c oxidase accessory protein CcoG n=1 Tax=Curvivirga aplysinae TaxID=2529852 RepID=UPI0012BC6DD3|nr:cytochrome c oxidase accessory protein CcoG [Curvivirga aplysinae]MTI08693.1 cytochrome c oxidase accessory protein CcoG [Curvivirga aplysinae]